MAKEDWTEKIFGAVIVAAAIVGVGWLLSAIGFNGIALTGIQTIATVILLLGGFMYFGTGFLSISALKADGVKRGTGGNGLWVVIIAVALVALACLAIYQSFVVKAPAPPASPVSTPADQIPSGSAADSSTYQVRGLGASVGPVVYPEAFALAQTIGVVSTDFDQGSAVTGLTVINLTDSTSGTPYQKSTLPQGQVASFLVSKANYLADFVTMRSGAGDTNPTAQARNKAYDTSVTLTGYNQGVSPTLNAITSSSTRATMTADSDYTFKLGIQPSAKNKRIAGGADEGYFDLYFNASSTSVWSAGSFRASVGAYFANQGTACSTVTLTTNPSALTGFVGGLRCRADFTGKDTNVYELAYTVHPSSAWSAGNATTQVCLTGVDYFQEVTARAADPSTGAPAKNKGSIQVGGVKDDGSAIQTLQCLNLYLQ